MADAEYKRLTCERCSINFVNPRATKYCSKRCRDGTKQTRQEYRESMRTDAIGNFECEHCGAMAYRGHSGTTGSKNKFCSMACRTGHSVASKAAKKNNSDKLKAIIALAKSILRINEPEKLKADKAATLRPPCVVCGNDCGYVFGRSKKYCSKECMRSTEEFKDARRAHKSKRKALMRGVHAEAFAPSKVFDRDGWKCQICGVSTPKSRRGTMHANAPELDHITPLSKGGHHTKANTQCACRSCNGWKSDRMVVGQIGLFSSLI